MTPAIPREPNTSARVALIHTLATAAGMGAAAGGSGITPERVRDAVAKIDRVHPALAAHLRGALHMGTNCSYAPNRPTTWTRK